MLDYAKIANSFHILNACNDTCLFFMHIDVLIMAPLEALLQVSSLLDPAWGRSYHLECYWCVAG